jgi:hypothetical protein
VPLARNQCKASGMLQPERCFRTRFLVSWGAIQAGLEILDDETTLAQLDGRVEVESIGPV